MFRITESKISQITRTSKSVTSTHACGVQVKQRLAPLDRLLKQTIMEANGNVLKKENDVAPLIS